MAKYVLIYHSADLDGLASGALLKMAFEGKKDCKFVPYNYDEPFDFVTRDTEQVVFADVTIPIREMIAMVEEYGVDVVVCDHHIGFLKECSEVLSPDSEYDNTSIWSDYNSKEDIDSPRPTVYSTLSKAISVGESLHAGNIVINGRTDMAGCEIVYETFREDIIRHMYIDRILSLENMIERLGDYDTWRHSNFGKENSTFVQEHQLGFKTLSNFSVDSIEKIFKGENAISQTEFVDTGHGIRLYQNAMNKSMISNGAIYGLFENDVPLDFLGMNFVAVNSFIANSSVFDSVNTKNVIMIPFWWKQNIQKWRVSFYSTNKDVDVSQLARHFGGGGHKGAAGCQISGDDLSNLLNMQLTEFLDA